MELDLADPKGLVRESYAIEGITAGECRSIFVDWALSIPVARSTDAALAALLAHYAAANPDHPMSVVLRAALEPGAQPRRRGGRSARVEGG